MQRAKGKWRTADSANGWLPEIQRFQSEFEMLIKHYLLCQKFTCKYKTKI